MISKTGAYALRKKDRTGKTSDTKDQFYSNNVVIDREESRRVEEWTRDIESFQNMGICEKRWGNCGARRSKDSNRALASAEARVVRHKSALFLV